MKEFTIHEYLLKSIGQLINDELIWHIEQNGCGGLNEHIEDCLWCLRARNIKKELEELFVDNRLNFKDLF